MKELSIEEKAKRYDEAIEIAKKINNEQRAQSFNIMTNIFPELKESEDEKIRKAIIEGLRAMKSSFHTISSIKLDDAIVWLEKQGCEHDWCHHKVDLSDCSEEYRKAYYDGWNNCNMQHSQCESEKSDVLKCLINGFKFYYEDNKEATWGTDKFSMKVKDILIWLEKQGKPIDKIVKRAKTEKQRVLLTETNGNANIDWDTRSLQDVKLLLEYGLDYIKKLEKQGEQKPADKVESKFCEGDWIIFNGLTLYVNEVVQGYYRTISIDGITNSYDWNIDNVARLWTIQDAKDGDVLYDYDEDCIVKFKKIGNIYWDNVIDYYCILDRRGFEIHSDARFWGYIINCKLIPATKEQCNQLEKAMADAGYAFDFEKKEMKKIEHTPAWSKKDREMTRFIGNAITADESSDYLKQKNIEVIDVHVWLDSLRDRVQPVQEWSEEDEKMLEHAIAMIEWYSAVDKIKSRRVSDWLKSLRLQNRWKPSDE